MTDLSDTVKRSDENIHLTWGTELNWGLRTEDFWCDLTLLPLWFWFLCLLTLSVSSLTTQLNPVFIYLAVEKKLQKAYNASIMDSCTEEDKEGSRAAIRPHSCSFPCASTEHYSVTVHFIILPCLGEVISLLVSGFWSSNVLGCEVSDLWWPESNQVICECKWMMVSQCLRQSGHWYYSCTHINPHNLTLARFWLQPSQVCFLKDKYSITWTFFFLEHTELKERENWTLIPVHRQIM